MRGAARSAAAQRKEAGPGSSQHVDRFCTRRAARARSGDFRIRRHFRIFRAMHPSVPRHPGRCRDEETRHPARDDRPWPIAIARFAADGPAPALEDGRCAATSLSCSSGPHGPSSRDSGRRSGRSAPTYMCGPARWAPPPTRRRVRRSREGFLNAAAARAFRAHAVVAGSVTGGVERFMAGALVGAGECFHARRRDRARRRPRGRGDGPGARDARELRLGLRRLGGRSSRTARTRSRPASARSSPDAAGAWLDTNAKATLKVYLARDAGDLRKGDLVTVDAGPGSLPRACSRRRRREQANLIVRRSRPARALLGVDAASPNRSR